MTFPQHALETIREKLLKEKQKTQETLASLVSQDPYSNPDRLNDNAASDTEANEESTHERMEALEKELKHHIEEIDAALARIEHGTYGKCQSCSNMITIERLGIKPTALLCVDCVRKKEK